MSVKDKLTPKLAKAVEDIQVKYSNILLACPLHEDEITGEVNIFPIFKTDNDLDIINRYFKFFPKEGMAYINAFNEWAKESNDEKGFSKMRTVRLAMKVPLALYKFIQIRYPDYWADRKQVRKFGQICSKLSVGKV